MPDQEGVKLINKTRFMTQDSTTPEEQPKVGKSTLVDTENLQVIPNDSTLGNTKISSPENPEATGQESVNKTLNKNTSLKRDDVQQPSEKAQIIINIMLAELSKSTGDDVQVDVFCPQAMFTRYARPPEEHNMIIYKATSDHITIYMYEAMKEPYSIEIRKATPKDLEYQLENVKFTIMRRSEIPQYETVLPEVWKMKRKQGISTRKINKYKNTFEY